MIGELGESLYVIPYVRVPDKYHRILFSGVTCCILGLAAHDAKSIHSVCDVGGTLIYCIRSTACDRD